MELRKELVSLLGTWSAKYKDEPGMRAIADLYELGRSKLGLGSVSKRLIALWAKQLLLITWAIELVTTAKVPQCLI